MHACTGPVLGPWFLCYLMPCSCGSLIICRQSASTLAAPRDVAKFSCHCDTILLNVPTQHRGSCICGTSSASMQLVARLTSCRGAGNGQIPCSCFYTLVVFSPCSCLHTDGFCATHRHCQIQAITCVLPPASMQLSMYCTSWQVRLNMLILSILASLWLHVICHVSATGCIVCFYATASAPH
jgi:hypothetical protein